MRALLMGPLLATALSLGAAAPSPRADAPPRLAPRAEPDTARLREALAAAFGDDMEIVRTELSHGLRERGGTFWLVHARPRRSGYYAMQYRYDYRDHHRPENPLYTHVEHTSSIRVGERECRRRREGKDVCLGDTVILPFVVNDYTGHTFQVTRRALPANESFPELPLQADTAGTGAVDNPLAAHLRFHGTGSHEMLRRNGGGSVVYSAVLEAVAPGRFNVAVSSRREDGTVPKVTPFGSIPVVIVPQGEPVTVLLENETVEGHNARDGFSSHRGNQYLATVLLLQPGDRITLEYGSGALPGPRHGGPPPPAAEAWPALAQNGSRLGPPEPAIAAFPFELDVDQRFNAWLAPHLPSASSP
jgi:hypothetical protein